MRNYNKLAEEVIDATISALNLTREELPGFYSKIAQHGYTKERIVHDLEHSKEFGVTVQTEVRLLQLLIMGLYNVENN